MKKNFLRIALMLASVVLLLCALTVFASAEKALIAEGYCVKEGGVSTNVKWELYNEDGTGVIYFYIDETIESSNTILHATVKETGEYLKYWDPVNYTASPWGQYTVKGEVEVTKAVIGDGITEISGAAFCGTKITTIEMPGSVKKLGGAAFARMQKLTTVNITGEEATPDVMNLKYITSIGNNTFEAVNRASKYVFNPDFAGEFGSETFKETTKMGELDVPAGVTKLGPKLFNGTKNLARLIIRGMNTEMTEATFEGMEAYPRIIGYVGSKAEAFAKENSFTFIDIETQKEIHKGTKPLAEAYEGELEEPFVPVWEDFDPTGATAHGHMTGSYHGTDIVNTYWAYYAETKTLKLVSGVKAYNETGSTKFFDDKAGWNKYVEEIEHIVIGDYIMKFSDALCAGMTNLKDVEMSRHITQMNSAVFHGCENLTTVYYRGNKKVEGQADFSGMKLINSIERTGIKSLKLGKNNENLEGVVLPGTLETIITPYFEEFDTFCRENMYDLQDSKNPDNKKNYCIRVDLDPSWISCGTRAAYEFDALTGTLTVHGVGPIADIANYYGGGSKAQPWLEIRENIKHLVITEYITAIGKYSFAECVNLETVQLPKVEKIEILNAAFEKCYNLKSIYIEGNQPIEGTLDLSLVKDDIPAWTFSYNYLIANVIVDESVRKIGKTTFEENLGLNLKGIYGVPGSYAQTYAEKNGLTFYDISKEKPSPMTCIPPELEDPEGGDETLSPDPGEDKPVNKEYNIIYIEDLPGGINDVPDAPVDNGGKGVNALTVVLIVVISACVLVVAGSAVGIVMTMKKSPKKSGEKGSSDVSSDKNK